MNIQNLTREKFRYLPLGDVRILNTIQIVFASILGALFLKEPCGPAEIQVVVAIMLGIVMVIQPPFLFNKSGSSDIKMGAVHFIAVGAMMFGTLAQAVMVVATRHQKDIKLIIQLFWTSLMPFVLGAIFCYMVGGWKVPEAKVLPSLFFFTISSVLSEISMMLSLRFALAGYAMAMRKILDILLAFVMQMAWFGQVPGTVAVLGVILISNTMILEGLRKTNTKKEDE